MCWRAGWSTAKGRPPASRPQGEFIWREPGSRHVAWCPEGGLMLAMFQVPNKFYERDGRVTDSTGADWDRSGGTEIRGQNVRNQETAAGYASPVSDS